jgi:elongation factor G
MDYPSDASGKATEGEVPSELAADAQRAREALIEMVAEADDALMEKFFDAGTLTQEDLVSGLKRGVAACRIFPLVCTSATTNLGIQPLLDTIISYVQPPAERPFNAKNQNGQEDVTVAATDSGPAVAFVWKTVADPFAGRITLFRVLSGVLKPDSTVNNVTWKHPSGSATSCCCRERPRPTCRRSGPPRRGGQAEGHVDQRPARRQDCRPHPADEVS